MSFMSFQVRFVCIVMTLMEVAVTTPVKSRLVHVRDASNFNGDAGGNSSTVLVVPNFPVNAIYKLEKTADRLDEAVDKIEAAVSQAGDKTDLQAENEPDLQAGNEPELHSGDKTEPEEEDETNKPENIILQKYYLIVDNKEESFDGAAKDCELRGYQFASIDDQEEYEILSNFLAEKFDTNLYRFWTSGNDLDEPGEYIWKSSGKRIPLEAPWWYENEPNQAQFDGVKEQCIELIGDDYPEKRFVLNDGLCDLKKHFICQKLIEKEKYEER